jgi:putative metallohydrolase (TIGR04338 family)
MEPGVAAPAWADLVATAMAERHLTHAEVAAALELAPEAWRRRRSGTVRPLTGEFARLAGLLDLSLADLLAGRPGPTGPDLELLTERDRGVYRAAGLVDVGPPMASLEAVRRYVADVLAGPWWARWAPEVRSVAVEETVGQGEQTPAWHQAEVGAGEVRHTLHLPPWSWRPLTVLHELAHVAAQPILWARPHGPQFVRLWVDAVAAAAGSEPARRLRAALGTEGIGWSARTRVAAERERGLAELGHLLRPVAPGGSFA